MQTLYFERRFRGPPNSANGGIAGGALAERLAVETDAPVKARLMRPIPLDRDLKIRPRPEDDGLVAYDDDGDIFAAWHAALDLDVPLLPSDDDIAAAARGYDKPDDHAYAHCFVCGHGRAPDDGLRVLAGTAPGAPRFAATRWTPHGGFAGPDGVLPLRYVWGALDCPGAVAAMLVNRAAMLTGEMHVEPLHPVIAGRPHTVLAWPIRAEGRKVLTGTALFDADGQLCARASELWIVLRD